MRKSLTLFLENNFIRDIPDRWLDPNLKSGLQNFYANIFYIRPMEHGILRVFFNVIAQLMDRAFLKASFPRALLHNSSLAVRQFSSFDDPQ